MSRRSGCNDDVTCPPNVFHSSIIVRLEVRVWSGMGCSPGDRGGSPGSRCSDDKNNRDDKIWYILMYFIIMHTAKGRKVKQASK